MALKKKLFYIVSHVQKSLAFEWTAIGLKDQYDLTFILLNPSSSSLELLLKANNINTILIRYEGKKNLPKAFLHLWWLFLRTRPDIVHTHLFDATLIGLTAAWLSRIKKRIYTRHNSTYHHLYFPDSVKYDLWSNYLATHIISISQATDETLIRMEGVNPEKVVKIPHGFDLESFVDIPKDRIQKLNEKWKIKNSHPVVGVIARHIEWKGIQFVIPAFKNFLKRNQEAVLVLANSSGPYHDEISALLKDIPSDHVILIPFEEDVAALYHTFDMYVHVPIDPTCEAFGQTYVEALAAGIPSVFTKSGIAVEFIEDGKNAITVPFRETDSIDAALQNLWEQPLLRSRLAEKGKKDVFLYFKVEPMISALSALYDQ